MNALVSRRNLADLIFSPASMRYVRRHWFGRIALLVVFAGSAILLTDVLIEREDLLRAAGAPQPTRSRVASRTGDWLAAMLTLLISPIGVAGGEHGRPGLVYRGRHRARNARKRQQAAEAAWLARHQQAFAPAYARAQEDA